MDSKTKLADLYSNHHQSRGRYGYLFCHGKRAPYLKEWIGTEKKVLDIGCRDGELTKYYAEGNTITGVDIDPKALEIIKEKLNIETLWLDVNSEWPFTESSYDHIVACEILEHLFYSRSFLEKVAKTLKDGGSFLGSVPNAFRMRNRMKFLWGNEFETDPTHVHMFSHITLKALLSEFFEDVEIVPVQGKILPFLPVSDKTPLKLNRLFSRDLLWKASKPKKVQE